MLVSNGPHLIEDKKEKSSLVKKIEQKILENSLLDKEKIAALKSKIAKKEFDILNKEKTILESAQRIAQKILSLEQELFGHPLLNKE